jgi:hypothetical protein
MEVCFWRIHMFLTTNEILQASETRPDDLKKLIAHFAIKCDGLPDDLDSASKLSNLLDNAMKHRHKSIFSSNNIVTGIYSLLKRGNHKYRKRNISAMFNDIRNNKKTIINTF